MASNLLNNASFTINTAGAAVSLPTTPAELAIPGAPYYINIHSDAASSDTVYISPNGASYFNFTFFNIPPVGGVAVRPGESITLGPVFGTIDPLQLSPETAGGGNCVINVTYSSVRSFGPGTKTKTKSINFNEGTFRCANNTNPIRISPPKEQNYWRDGDVAYLNVFLRQNGAAPAGYKVYLVPPNSTDTTSAYFVENEESITLGPFTKENCPDIYAPPVPGVQGICFGFTPVVDGSANPTPRPLDFKYSHNVVQDISNSGPAADIEMYLRMDDAPGSPVIHNYATYNNPVAANGPTLQEQGIDAYGVSFDGLNQALQSTPGSFPFNQGQTSNYAISGWFKADAYPGDPGYLGIDSTCYLISNTNVGFGPRWGFMLFLSSALSAYGVDGGIVWQPRHGATPFGVGTGFRNLAPEFLAERGKWMHIVCNRDIVSGIEMWINGELAVSDPFNETSANASNGDITLACRGNEGVSTFNNRNTLQGTMDEWLLMNRTLTPAEITALYEAGLARLQEIE